MPLSPEQFELLTRRREGLAVFLDERIPVLTHFVEAIGLPTPERLETRPAAFLGGVAKWLDQQEVTEEDFVWVVTRVGYLLGEILVARFGGQWFLNEDPNTRSFGHYVIGRFEKGPNGHIIDPMHIAAHYAQQPPGRDLRRLLARVEDQVRKLN